MSANKYMPRKHIIRGDGNQLVSATLWTPDYNGDHGLKAALANLDIWGGWIFVSDTKPGYVVWFDSSYTKTEILGHEFTSGHLGRIINEDRLFSGIYPTGIVYADRKTEVRGDFKKLGFLSFSNLTLEIEKDCPIDLKIRIMSEAKAIQEKQGESFQVSTSGQSITLGYAL